MFNSGAPRDGRRRMRYHPAMSDEFGTISAKRGTPSRDVEAIRAHYRRHRETLMGLVADAPTELIAADYRRVIADIDIALAKLDSMEGVRAAAPSPPPPPRSTEPGMRPLVTTRAEDPSAGDYVTEGSDARSRLILIVIAAVIALAAIGWLIWRASDRPDRGAVVEEQPATTTTLAEEAPSPAAPATPVRVLTVSPDSIDYGVIRKGTRATRQYEIVNRGEEPITVQVARSACRCLYYEHAPVVPPKGKETLTVTIDGAKAKAGPLLESIKVTSKADPTVVTTFDVTATVR